MHRPRTARYPEAGRSAPVWVLAALLVAAGTSCAAAEDAATATEAAEPPPHRATQLPPAPEATPFSVYGHVVSEGVFGLEGGNRRDSVADNLLHVAMALNSGPLGLWSGGQLYGSLLQLQSGAPNEGFIGALQLPSDIAGAPATRVNQFWYRQDLPWRGLLLRAGLIDLNRKFDASNNAALLINASFGISPTFTANVPTSTYPKPGWGATLEGDWTDSSAYLGVFQSRPDLRSSVFDKGAMVIGQLGYRGVTIGLWNYSQPQTAGLPAQDWGAYGIAEGDVPGTGEGNAGYFLQWGASPRSGNVVPYYLGAGFLLRGPLPGRAQDRLSFGIARAWVRGSGKRPETDYELTYRWQLMRGVFLQPDLQYVSRPGGAGRDALVGLIRFQMGLH